MLQTVNFFAAAFGGVFVLSLFGRKGLAIVVPQPVARIRSDKQDSLR
jgi:hypothetical protein